jgi:parvulin-like peptidyl-prolyl isomerase
MTCSNQRVVSTDKYFMHISEVIAVKLGKRQQQRKRLLPSTPIPDQLKRELVIRKLTKQLTQKSNLPNPTKQDINAAIERYKMMQKRVDLEYDDQLKLAQQRQNTH